jgi:hypothetical protein
MKGVEAILRLPQIQIILDNNYFYQKYFSFLTDVHAN